MRWMTAGYEPSRRQKADGWRTAGSSPERYFSTTVVFERMVIDTLDWFPAAEPKAVASP